MDPPSHHGMPQRDNSCRSEPTSCLAQGLSQARIHPISSHFCIGLGQKLLDCLWNHRMETQLEHSIAPMRLRPLDRRSIPGNAKSPRWVGARHLMMSWHLRWHPADFPLFCTKRQFFHQQNGGCVPPSFGNHVEDHPQKDVQLSLWSWEL